MNELGYKPVFVRNGIRIPKVRERRLRGHQILAIAVIDDGPLAALLGDAETPAHTRWEPDTRNFKGKYEYGKEILEFVSEAPRQLAEILSRKYEQQDRLVLADLFPRPPLEQEIEATPESEQDPGEHAERPFPPKTSLRAAFRVERVDGGFRVLHAPNGRIGRGHVAVHVAYDRSRGDPLRRYHPADFNIANMPASVSGARIVNRKDNHMQLEIDDASQFFLEVTGVDSRRDLYVRVRSVARSDDPTS